MLDENILKVANYLKIASEQNITIKQVEATIALLDGGATIPFIARYRKEITSMLDEVQIAYIRDRIEQLRELDKRKEAIIKSINEQGKLTDDLKSQIENALTMSEVEDIYLPFKPKRTTRASKAREKGLEPLALLIFEQDRFDVLSKAKEFVNAELGVKNEEEALAGARDIIAEMVNEDRQARGQMRKIFIEKGIIRTRVIEGKEEEGAKFRDYFEYAEPISKAPSHRILAIRRAESEGIIAMDLAPEEEDAISPLANLFVKTNNQAAKQVELAIKDAYKRLLKPSMETEIRLHTKQIADEEAVKVFADNLRHLLLSAPFGQRAILAIDPAFRTGCKVVCLDAQGNLLYHTVVHLPWDGGEDVKGAGNVLRALADKYKVRAFAIGNGTASRETERFVRSLDLPKSIQIIMVNESGASVYSASEVAREEFPTEDITVRGAVSIGRRLMDPLAELVKIDPKAIGVGQYQHDVDQKLLKSGLDDTVISCVNAVGVEVNSASKELLSYVSGLSNALAKGIVEYRKQHGAFRTRKQLREVPRLGDKAFEQAAGFLRIFDSENPLDASTVHPESYPIVEKMAKDLKCTVKDLMTNADLRKQIDLKKYVSETVGLPTLNDILKELEKPARDPREHFEVFEFAEGIEKMSDLRLGMRLPGIITNITDFGAFVDVGVHQDGLLHLSQISDKFIAHPKEMLKVQQRVMVTVTEVDVARKRISLTMKENFTPPAAKEPRAFKPAEVAKPKEATKAVETNKPAQTKNFAADKKATPKVEPKAKESASSSKSEGDEMADKLNALKELFKKK